MGWERGRYDTRSRREDGRIVREYVGSGEVAALIAQFDAIERDRRAGERIAVRLERERIDALDAPLLALDNLADLMTRAALLAAGYRQHHRGEWRRRRGRRDYPG
jgi:hypothetical protein